MVDTTIFSLTKGMTKTRYLQKKTWKMYNGMRLIIRYIDLELIIIPYGQIKVWHVSGKNNFFFLYDIMWRCLGDNVIKMMKISLSLKSVTRVGSVSFFFILNFFLFV